jgi:hypothetical protein
MTENKKLYDQKCVLNEENRNYEMRREAPRNFSVLKKLNSEKHRFRLQTRLRLLKNSRVSRFDSHTAFTKYDRRTMTRISPDSAIWHKIQLDGGAKVLRIDFQNVESRLRESISITFPFEPGNLNDIRHDISLFDIDQRAMTQENMLSISYDAVRNRLRLNICKTCTLST